MIQGLKSTLKANRYRVLVDKHVGGELLEEIKKLLSNSEIHHVGRFDNLKDAKDEEIIEFARKNGYSLVITMDYGFARMAVDAGLEVIFVFEYEGHKRYAVTYLAKLGEVDLRPRSTL